MESLGEKTTAYAFYAASMLALALSFLFGSSLIALAALVFVFLSTAYYHSGKLINNLIIKNSRMLVLSKGYELTANGSSAVRKVGDAYESVSAAFLVIDNPLGNISASMQPLLEKVHTPFEFSIEIEELSKKKIIDDLETKMHIKEIELSNARESDAKNLNRIKRELSFIENEINTIKNGNKPFNVRFKIKCRAESHSMLEAANTSYKNLEHVAGLFSNALDIDYRVLRGEELLSEA
ncbi:MAG: hypothetical protein ACP5HW_00525 [Candidatus Micrarchaeia archaeon]